MKEEIIEKVEKLSPKDKDVIIFKIDDCLPRSWHDKAVELAGHIRGHLFAKQRNIQFIIIPKSYDISSLDEGEMAKYGWYRKESFYTE